MITREELYALVWSVPGRVAAHRLNVSDSYLGRVCVALGVPRPPRGWWAKHRAGTAPPPPPLSITRPGFPDAWTKGGRGTPIKQFYRQLIWSVSQDDTTHPLVRLGRNVFHAAKDSGDRTHLVPHSYSAIDLTTSAEMLENALSLANALFQRFESRGHPVLIAAGGGFIRPPLNNWITPLAHTERIRLSLWAPKTPTVTVVSGVPIGLAIMEVAEEVLMRYVGDGEFVRASSVGPVDGITWTEWQRAPTRRLKITAYSPHHPAAWQRDWAESRRGSLVRTVEAIVDDLEAAAPTLPHASSFLRER